MLAEATPIDPDAKKMLRATGTTSALGLEIAAYIAVAFLGGEHLDKQLGTAPWLKWILFVGGLGAAVRALVRVARSYQRSLAREARDEPARSTEQASPALPKRPPSSDDLGP